MQPDDSERCLTDDDMMRVFGPVFGITKKQGGIAVKGAFPLVTS